MFGYSLVIEKILEIPIWNSFCASNGPSMLEIFARSKILQRKSDEVGNRDAGLQNASGIFERKQEYWGRLHESTLKHNMKGRDMSQMQ